MLGHHQAEHRVTEVLEPLVGRAPPRLGTPRAVGQGLDEQDLVPEGRPSRVIEVGQIGGLQRRATGP